MNISGVSEKTYGSITGLNLRRRIFDILPDLTIKNPIKYNKLGPIISRPDVNRGILGATALLTQPYIDSHNHKVDEETAAVSACRTTGKVLAGTAAGVGVRSVCCYLVDNCTSIDKNAPKWKKWLMPSQKVENEINKRNLDWFKNHKNSLATLLSLGVMLFTNVLIDVPLTNLISNCLISHRKNIISTNQAAQNEGKVKS